ncbi:c-type cytochrome [Bradyrhizobium erythrophlei]|uniref:c-type cytochrome n=1 Tax=Bradyrhizobium erythrophlei TaxID=1437360 RepID=UPI0035EC6CB2
MPRPAPVSSAARNGPAYDVENHLILVGAVDWCTIHKLAGPDYERGQLRFGGTPIPVNDPPASGWITAVDAEPGAVKWRYHTEAPVVAAVTQTARHDIHRRHRRQLAGLPQCRIAVIEEARWCAGQRNHHLPGERQAVRRRHDRQRVARHLRRAGFAKRRDLAAVSMRITTARAIGALIFGLAMLNASAAEPSDAGHGKQLYGRYCSVCHVQAGSGGLGPALKGIASRLSSEETQQQIEQPRAAMPRLYPNTLNEGDVVAYVLTL